MNSKLNFVIYGGGYIGTELYYGLRRLNHNVISITRSKQDLYKPFTRELIINEFEKCYSDSSNESLDELSKMNDRKFVFVNCAAIAKTLYKDGSIIDINTTIVKNELNILEDDDIFIQISSYYYNLDTPYGNSKRLSDELVLNEISNKYSKNNRFVFRISFPFGSIMTLPNNGIIASIFRNESLILYKEALKCINRYNYVGDIIKMINKIAHKEINEKIIYCAGYDMSLESFIRLYETYNGTLFKTVISNPSYVSNKIEHENNFYGIEKTDIEKMFYNSTNF